ncbi:MAG TPA: hypothetical protein GX699_05340 [Firmicutes bacterium]|nr:hypothetical protein [Bacillota bacterium]
MKKTFILAVVVFMVFLGLKHAASYSSASVFNRVFLEIVPAEDGLVSLVCPDSNYTITQGERQEFLLLTNNIADQLAYEITTDDESLQLIPPANTVSLTQKIDLYVPDNYRAGDVPVTVLLTGRWSGGNVEIKTTIPVHVKAKAKIKAPAGQNETAGNGELQGEEAPAGESGETISGTQEATGSRPCTCEEVEGTDITDCDIREAGEEGTCDEIEGGAVAPEEVTTAGDNVQQEVQPETVEQQQISETGKGVANEALP